MISSSEPPADSEFLSFFILYSRLLADIGENGSIWSNLRLKMSFVALGRLQNHKVPHLHPNSTMFMPLDRLQLKMYAFSGKFNVCSKRVLLSWIKICRDFTLQTQIFTQKYRSWLRFYSEFLRKKMAVEVSGSDQATLWGHAHGELPGYSLCFYSHIHDQQNICIISQVFPKEHDLKEHNDD